MILRELVLHNFGVFRGRKVVSLEPPDANKPIILFGGLNGAGKTTILDAVQLALYGPRATCSKRNSLGYEDFLKASISRGVPTTEGSAIELEFSLPVFDQVKLIRVRRYWRVAASGVRERVEVLLDGEYDQNLTEEWADHVEEILPHGLSRLFFFDGDRIEALADLTRSREVLDTALQTLLGLDLVDRLNQDLVILERRKAKEVSSDPDETAELESLSAQLEAIEGEIAERTAQLEVMSHRLAEFKASSAELDRRFSKEGGNLVERRHELESRMRQAKQDLRASEERLRRLAGGSTPLVLVKLLLESLLEEDERDQRREQASLLARLLEERDQALLPHLVEFVKPDSMSRVRQLLSRDREARTVLATEPLIFSLQRGARSRLRELLEHDLARIRDEAKEARKDKEENSKAYQAAERALAQVPDPDAISGLLQERAESKAALQHATESLRRAEEQLAELRRRKDALEKKAQRASESLFERTELDDSARRVARYSKSARTVLGAFRAEVVKRNIDRIQELILDSFHLLLRKRGLVHSIRIDPGTLEMKLLGDGGFTLSSDRLSQGERQLLAVSMLWGLARASGRALPLIIDTPLGRLDSVHRRHVVQRYLPRAGHQVILLSTDEEIDEAHLSELADSICLTYHLEYHEESDSSTVNPGYFFTAIEACA